ncbi:MAG: protein-export chaperone SecB [Holosporaceae bacterium]|nr:protein-export chaperone SecB [Holosporaceae bacterium]
MVNRKEKESEQQFFGVVSQYVNDLSFEVINAPSRLHGSQEQPQIDVHLDVKTDKCDDLSSDHNVYAVNLAVTIQAKMDKPMFILELEYTGEFAIGGFGEDILDQILNIECPRLLFPFVRSVIASAVGDGGFPPLYLSPIDFVEFYEERKNKQSKASQ